MVSKNILSLAGCKDMNEYYEMCWKLAQEGKNEDFETRIEDMKIDDIAVFIQVLAGRIKQADERTCVALESAIWMLCEELRTR